jgi:hypothetical protein
MSAHAFELRNPILQMLEILDHRIEMRSERRTAEAIGGGDLQDIENAVAHDVDEVRRIPRLGSDPPGSAVVPLRWRFHPEKQDEVRFRDGHAIEPEVLRCLDLEAGELQEVHATIATPVVSSLKGEGKRAVEFLQTVPL